MTQIYDAAGGSAGRKDCRHPRVLLFGSKLSGGGAQTRLFYLSKYLFGGSDTALLMGLDKGHTRDERCSLFELGWNGRFSYPRTVVRFRRILIKNRYDVVLALGLHQNAVLWLATRGMKSRPAIIMTEITRPHTNDILAGRKIIENIRSIMHRVIYKDADLVAANSIDGVAEIVEAYLVRRDRIIRIPNIIDVTRLADAKSETVALQPSPRTVCMVARMEKMKRIDTLIEAVTELISDDTWSVELIGDGPHRKALEKLSHTNGLAERIYFRGWQSNPYPYIARASMTVLCSEYEGFSNTVLESMVLGTPVITSMCSSDAREMVKAGAALGFEVGDAKALRAHIMKLLGDDTIRRDLVQKARIYMQPHLLEYAMPEYENMINLALDFRNRKSTVVR